MLLLFVLGLALPQLTQAQNAANPITVIEQNTTSDFRKSLTLHVKVSSSAGNIISAKVFWFSQFSQAVTNFKSAPQVDLNYKWNPVRTTTPPFEFFTYHWEFTDSAGNLLVTPPEQGEFTDKTRDWQNLTDGKVTVYWYDRDAAFGKNLLSVAQRGYQHIEKATGHTPSHDLRVVMYNGQKDFCSFEGAGECLDWISGQTFDGITVQWIGPDNDEHYVMYQTVPHELAHAFLGDWLGTRRDSIPRWFDEGQAVNNQIEGIDDMLTQARALASQDQLEQINKMDFDPALYSSNNDQVNNWYAQATSIVNYLYDQDGLDSLGKIVTQVNQGIAFPAAFQSVTGKSIDEFERGWRVWLGDTVIQPTTVPSPTPYFPPTPTYDTSFLSTATP